MGCGRSRACVPACGLGGRPAQQRSGIASGPGARHECAAFPSGPASDLQFSKPNAAAGRGLSPAGYRLFTAQRARALSGFRSYRFRFSGIRVSRPAVYGSGNSPAHVSRVSTACLSRLSPVHLCATGAPGRLAQPAPISAGSAAGADAPQRSHVQPTLGL